MYIYIYIYTYLSIHTYIHTYTHTYIYIYCVTIHHIEHCGLKPIVDCHNRTHTSGSEMGVLKRPAAAMKKPSKPDAQDTTVPGAMQDLHFINTSNTSYIKPHGLTLDQILCWIYAQESWIDANAARGYELEDLI